MSWIDLLVISNLTKDNLLSIYKTRAYIDTKRPCLEELMRNFPVVKEDTILKKIIAMVKENDKEQNFDRSKV